MFKFTRETGARTGRTLTMGALRVEAIAYPGVSRYLTAHLGRIGFVVNLRTGILVVDGPDRVHVFQPGHGHQSARRAAIDL